jgi:RNA polymerase sigma-70 factor, ECF subfamily
MQLHELTDFQVVERIQSGDNDAFDELMRRYKRPVVNFIYRMLGDASEADDVAQEVFVRVYQHIGEFTPRAKFSTWLFALAHNAALDRSRWRKRHPTESLDSVPEAATATSVADQTHINEVGKHIATAVAALPEDQRTAIVLAEYQGMSYAEIAAIMRCSEKSVESRLYRAKQTLRERLRFLLE